jgi:hypothetical protein
MSPDIEVLGSGDHKKINKLIGRILENRAKVRYSSEPANPSVK